MTLYHPLDKYGHWGDIQDARKAGVRCFDERSE